MKKGVGKISRHNKQQGLEFVRKVPKFLDAFAEQLNDRDARKRAVEAAERRRLALIEAGQRMKGQFKAAEAVMGGEGHGDNATRAVIASALSDGATVVLDGEEIHSRSGERPGTASSSPSSQQESRDSQGRRRKRSEKEERLLALQREKEDARDQAEGRHTFRIREPVGVAEQGRGGKRRKMETKGVHSGATTKATKAKEKKQKKGKRKRKGRAVRNKKLLTFHNEDEDDDDSDRE